MQGPAMEVEWLVYINMLMRKVYLVKPAIIIKPKMESARHSISVARAPHLESVILSPTIRNGRSASMVRGSVDLKLSLDINVSFRLPLRHGDCYSLYEHDPRLFSNTKLKSSKRASYMCSLYPEPWNLGDSPGQVSWNWQFPSYPSQQIFHCKRVGQEGKVQQHDRLKNNRPSSNVTGG